MSNEGDYISARWELLRIANRCIGHEFDKAEDPGWDAEMDDEQLDEAALKMADAIRAKKEAASEQR